MTDIRCPQCNQPLAAAGTPCVACTPTRMDLPAQPPPVQSGDATIPDAPAARRTTPPTVDITLPEPIASDAPPTLVGQPQRMRPADVTEPNQAPRTVAFAKKPSGPEFPSISGYRVEKVLGEGGMGAVFLAHDEMLDRKVAIKVITNADGDKTAQARFVREARSMASAEHPNIVRVLSFGTVDERPYLVMELVDGESLADRIRNVKRFPPAEALRLLRPVVEALAASWSKGIVHRDIKPSNILIDSKNHVRVADFGLAKTASGGTDSELTGSGLMVGTPFYVAPEQATAQAMDFRADIYSVGIVLYEMLTGEKPFTGSNAISVVAKHLHEQLPPLRERRNDLSPRMIALVEKMTAKSADKRHPSYELLLRDFDAIINEPTPRTMAAPVSAPQPRVAAPAPAVVRPVARAAQPPSKKWIGAVIAAVVVVLAVAGAVIASRNNEKAAASAQAAADGQAATSTVEVTGTESPATETTPQVTVLPAPEALAAFTSGMSLLEAEKPSDAIAQFDKALKIESTYASARLRKAEALATLDSTVDAEREYLQLLSDKAQLTRLDQREQFLALAGLALLRDNQGAIVRLRSDTKNAYDTDDGFIRIQKAFQRRQMKANDLELQRALQSTASPRPAPQQPQVSGYTPPAPAPGPTQTAYPPPPYYPPPQPPPRPPGPPGGGPPPPPRR